MMARLAAELRLEEALGTLGEAFSTRQLPPLRTLDALIAPRSATSVTAEIALGARSSVAVVSIGTGRTTFATLQLQTLHAGGAVHSRDALRAGVQTLGTHTDLHVVTLVAHVHTPLTLQQQIRGARQTLVFSRSGTGFARRVTWMTVAVLEVFRFVTVVVSVGDAFPLPVHRPVVVAAEADGTVAAGGAPVRAGDALVALLVPVEAVGAGVQAAAFVREPSSPAQDALALRRPVARGAGCMTIGTVVILRFVGVLRAGGVAAVLMHN